MGARVPYPKAGAAMRSTIERACALDPPLSGREWSVLATVIGMTGSWSKLDDTTYLGVIAAKALGVEQATETQTKNTGRVLAKLERRGVIGRRVPIGRHELNPRPGYVVWLLPPGDDQGNGARSDTVDPGNGARSDTVDPSPERETARDPTRNGAGSDAKRFEIQHETVLDPDPLPSSSTEKNTEEDTEAEPEPGPATALDAARRLVTRPGTHNEIPAKLGRFINAHGEPAVLAALQSLQPVEYPNYLIDALTAVLPITRTPARPTGATTAPRHPQPDLCGHCDEGWIHHDDDTVSRCPCQTKGTT